ncbi:TIR domain-containing protein [Tianweitania populi]|uniref:CD-NTase-associated protein 12/Pycsar effector protein TIR domain-containing protein n=1 Tax=Tianweitania populi TaxID=1607949 RepID=A0A8J3DXR8_9HYPH|nr:nucleotide-binding protein [Tianweitania populi]GHD21400.1 hypothetical protein GCM10016234_35010 [Tianweitania populi]
MASVDIFREINNALLDLQASQSQTYTRPLKRLAQLLEADDLAPAVSSLTEGIDLDAFLERKGSRASMIGSDQLNWPDDRREELGLTLLLIRRFAENPDFMIDFGHTYFYSGSKYTANIHSVVSQLLIPFARDFKVYVESKEAPVPRLVLPVSEKIFVVHGHDGEAREAVARFIEKLGLEAIILHEQANQGRTVIEKVEANADVGFAVVLLTPDDTGSKKGSEPEPRARQNVLLELGYFLGKLGRSRVCALKRGELEIPSDFAGVVWEAMDQGNGWKASLARELQAAGYVIDWNKVMQ